MVSMTDLDARLRRHHEELTRQFTEHRASMRMPRRRVNRRLISGFLVAAAVAVAAPLVSLHLAPSRGAERELQIAGFAITAAAGGERAPQMTRDQAIAVAAAFNASHPVELPHGGPAISGLTVTGAWFVSDVQHVVGPCVNFFLPSPTDLWIVTVSAPAQSGWNGVRGAFLVDDARKSTGGAQLLMGPAEAGLPGC
jgi:hypothetical protein